MKPGMPECGVPAFLNFSGLYFTRLYPETPNADLQGGPVRRFQMCNQSMKRRSLTSTPKQALSTGTSKPRALRGPHTSRASEGHQHVSSFSSSVPHLGRQEAPPSWLHRSYTQGLSGQHGSAGVSWRLLNPGDIGPSSIITHKSPEPTDFVKSMLRPDMANLLF